MGAGEKEEEEEEAVITVKVRRDGRQTKRRTELQLQYPPQFYPWGPQSSYYVTQEIPSLLKQVWVPAPHNGKGPDHSESVLQGELT